MTAMPSPRERESALYELLGTVRYWTRIPNPADPENPIAPSWTDTKPACGPLPMPSASMTKEPLMTAVIRRDRPGFSRPARDKR